MNAQEFLKDLSQSLFLVAQSWRTSELTTLSCNYYSYGLEIQECSGVQLGLIGVEELFAYRQGTTLVPGWSVHFSLAVQLDGQLTF